MTRLSDIRYLRKHAKRVAVRVTTPEGKTTVQIPEHQAGRQPTHAERITHKPPKGPLR